MSHQQSFSYVGTGLLGLTSSKLGLMCFAQGHNTVTPVRLEPGSQLKHSTTKPLCSIKPVFKGHSKIYKTKIFMTNGSLMKIESIAQCSPWSILQYFWPALSNNWFLKPIFCLFLSGHFTQVLLYIRPLTRWICQHGCLKEALAHIRSVPKSCVVAHIQNKGLPDINRQRSKMVAQGC